ncbi:hypothetical protein IZY60_15165, partial [Lutibacter sp. B2]|nr:hypothetical protein [Lutibacter sp. B2]
MQKENLTTDVYMTTEHKRKKKKPKTTFDMVMNKVLVGALVLTSLASSTTPAFASETDILQSKMKNLANSNANITQNYEVSVESTIFNLNETIKAIESMKATGTVTQDILLN